MNYWGDAQPNANAPWMTCGCGMTEACLNPSHLCNCDTNNLQDWRMDEGWLTVKYDLPVTSFRAGDTGMIVLEITHRCGMLCFQNCEPKFGTHARVVETYEL